MNQSHNAIKWLLLGSMMVPPQHIVDLSLLNKTNTTESPFQLARRISKDSWKTPGNQCLEWIPQCPLHTSDCHLTTLITPFGCWRYTRASQGFLSSQGRLQSPLWCHLGRIWERKNTALMTQSIMTVTLNSIGGGQLISSPVWANQALPSTLRSSSLHFRDVWPSLGSG